MKGGKFYQGDYGCVVYPGLTPNSESAVTKVFKDPVEKNREEKINQLLKTFTNDFIVKKIDGPIDPLKNPEINECKVGRDNHPITLKEIQANSISYEYLGKSYEEITQAELNEAFKALLKLTLKVIDMNSKGITHNDIASRNITFKDGRAYLIDIGAFEFKTGTQNFKDVSDLLKILVLIASRDNLLSGEDYQYLREVSSSPLNPRTIESVKEVLNSLFIQGAKAPMLPAIQSAAGSKKYSRGNKAVAAKMAALVSSENRKSGQGPTAKARRRGSGMYGGKTRRGKKGRKSHSRRR